MSVARQRLVARVVLACFVVAGLAWLWHLSGSGKISTDVLDLIPAKDQQPELAMVRSLATQRMGRVVLVTVKVGVGKRRAEATHAFADSLRGSGCFEEVVVMSDASLKETTGKAVFDERLNLLFPAWIEREEAAYRAAGSPGAFGPWVADRAAATLEQFLAKPEALAFQGVLPSDPLLLTPSLVEHLHAPASMVGGANSGDGLVWALQRANPLAEAGQLPVFAAIAGAERAAQRVEPSASVQWTGVARFAFESRARIKKELTLLNIASLILVGLVGSLGLSQAVKALNLVPPVLCGLLGAWVFTTLSFEHVHVLVFVIGSLLGGVAIDYGFYLYLQPPAFPGEPYSGKVRRLLKPLLSSALTTVLGFSFLLASDLPLIRQLGVFVSAGLLCALGAALLWFGQLRSYHLPARAFISWRPTPSRATRRIAFAGVFLALIVGLVGPWFLRWRDSIQQLEIPAVALHRNDREVRAAFGEGAGSAIYLTRGATPAEARDAWARFDSWHTRHFPSGSLFSVAEIVPRYSTWRATPARIAKLGNFDQELREALVRHGFDAAAFGPFFTAWAAWRSHPLQGYDAMVGRFASKLRGPATLLFSFKPGASWYASLVGQSAPMEPPRALQTLSTNQLETLNRVFSQYRISAMHLSLAGLALVGLSVFAIYGLRRGLRVFSIPVGACLCSLGLLGLMGQTLNLFHLLGAFLGVCLSHNYAIFSTENSLRGEGMPPSIRLSGLTTALSFGVLAFSHIAVVSALGVTVALEVTFALFIVELQSLLPEASASTPVKDAPDAPLTR